MQCGRVTRGAAACLRSGPHAYTESAPLPRGRGAARPEKAMAVIVIKDLTESVDLDREAMTAILGGSRSGGAAGRGWHGLRRRGPSRLAAYPQGWPANPHVRPLERIEGKLPRK